MFFFQEKLIMFQVTEEIYYGYIRQGKFTQLGKI